MAGKRSSRPGWEVGDRLPPLVLPDRKGKPFDLAHQTIAGRTLVLVVHDGWPSGADNAALAGQVADFHAAEAEVIQILCGIAPNTTPPYAEDLGARALLDPDRRLLQFLGISGGILIADPRGRIVAVEEGRDLARTLLACQTIFAASEPATLQAAAPVLIVENVVEPALRDRLVGYWNAGEKVEDRVAGSSDQQAAASIKKRADVHIEDKDLFLALKDRLGKRVLPEIRKAFAFEVKGFEALRIGCYESSVGGFFARHRDNSTPFTAHRRFAMSLNLNTGAYTGGELRFPEFGRQLYQPPAGGAVIFSCSLLHEALPVTTGRRFAVFTFFYDEAGTARERQSVERELAAGRQGVTIR